MTKYAKLPDGNFAAFPDDWDEARIDSTLRKDRPDLFKDVPKISESNALIRGIGSTVSKPTDAELGIGKPLRPLAERPLIDPNRDYSLETQVAKHGFPVSEAYPAGESIMRNIGLTGPLTAQDRAQAMNEAKAQRMREQELISRGTPPRQARFESEQVGQTYLRERGVGSPVSLPERLGRDILSGAGQVAKGNADFVALMKNDPDFARAEREQLGVALRQLLPADPTITDEIAAATGSMVASLGPGWAVSKVLQTVTRLSPSFANWAGAIQSGALEATPQAGTIYQELADSGVPLDKAQKEALTAFTADFMTAAMTDRAVFFNTGGLGARWLKGGVGQGIQEGEQSATEDVAMGRPIDPEKALSSAGVGAAAGLIGGAPILAADAATSPAAQARREAGINAERFQTFMDRAVDVAARSAFAPPQRGTPLQTAGIDPVTLLGAATTAQPVEPVRYERKPKTDSEPKKDEQVGAFDEPVIDERITDAERKDFREGGMSVGDEYSLAWKYGSQGKSTGPEQRAMDQLKAASNVLSFAGDPLQMAVAQASMGEGEVTDLPDVSENLRAAISSAKKEMGESITSVGMAGQKLTVYKAVGNKSPYSPDGTEWIVENQFEEVARFGADELAARTFAHLVDLELKKPTPVKTPTLDIMRQEMAQRSPWKVSRQEYVAAGAPEDAAARGEKHRLEVRRALNRGEEVPESALEEYPDLQDKAPGGKLQPGIQARQIDENRIPPADTEVEIATGIGKKRVHAWKTKVPGLVITESYTAKGYTLTLAGSGMRISQVKNGPFVRMNEIADSLAASGLRFDIPREEMMKRRGEYLKAVTDAIKAADAAASARAAARKPATPRPPMTIEYAGGPAEPGILTPAWAVTGLSAGEYSTKPFRGEVTDYLSETRQEMFGIRSVVALTGGYTIRKPAGKRAKTINSALTMLKSYGMPIENILHGVNTLAISNNNGSSLAIHTLASHYRRGSDGSIIALSEKVADAFSDAMNIGDHATIIQVLASMAHELMHVVDAKKYTQVSAEFDIGSTGTGGVWLSDMLQELLKAYADSRTSSDKNSKMFSAFSYPMGYVVALTKYREMEASVNPGDSLPFVNSLSGTTMRLDDAIKHAEKLIKAEAFAQIGSAYYTVGATEEGMRILKEKIPRAVEFMERIHNVIANNRVGESDVELRRALQVVGATGNTAGDAGGPAAREYQQGTQDREEGGLGPRPGERQDRLLIQEKRGADDSAPGAEWRISTRLPTNKRATEDPVATDLQVNLESMKVDPEKFSHNMVNVLGGYDLVNAGLTDPDEIARVFKSHVIDNLRWLYEQMPPDVRERAKLWYDGANKIANRLAKDYGVPPQAAAGVLAALSPQMDWYKNVSLAERVLSILAEHRNTGMTPEMRAAMKRIPAFTSNDGTSATSRAILGKTLQESIDLGAEYAAFWVRAYDEAHNERSHRMVTPEGALGDFVLTKAGEKAGTGWGGFGEIAKAISVVIDPSRENITQQMGNQHKVRNFYNNIIAPNANSGDVTIDTHAVAAALLKPLAGGDIPVHHNFGSAPPKAKQGDAWIPTKANNDSGAQGVYGLYADAYRELAAELGILPRELQSITWEAVRGLFTAKFKAAAKNKAAVDSVWYNYHEGILTLEEARNEISELAGGIELPSWHGRSGRASGEARNAGNAGKLRQAGMAGRGSKRSSARAAGRDTGAPARNVDWDLWSAPEQLYSSADTSINDKKLPAVFTKVRLAGGWQSGTVNVDLGGGRFDNAVDALAEQGVESLVFDPFNRAPDHNRRVAERVANGGADTATISNVLNVIQESENRERLLLQAMDALKPGGTLYVTVYEGNGTGVGAQTSKGWQENRKLRDYLDEVKQVFPDASMKGGMIIAKKEGPAAGDLIQNRIVEDEADVRAKADQIKAMTQEERDNLEVYDFGAKAYLLYEAETMMPKKEGTMKMVNDSNSFILWQEADAVANINGDPWLASKEEDPDNEDEIVWRFNPVIGDMKNGFDSSFADKKSAIAEFKDHLAKKAGAGMLYANPLQPVVEAYQDVARSAINLWNDKIGYKWHVLGKLPDQDEYQSARYKAQAKIEMADEIAKEVYKAFRNAQNPEQIYDYLTTRGMSPTTISDVVARKKAIAVKKLIDKVGRGLVARGLIPKEAYEKFQDQYLPRLYLRHILGEDVVKSLATGKKPDLSWMKSRKDIPEEIRHLVLGEIRDAAFLAGASLGTTMRDIAIMDFLELISENKDWVFGDSIVKWKGRNVSVHWMKNEVTRIEAQAAHYNDADRAAALQMTDSMRKLVEQKESSMGKLTKDFVRVPESPKYGALAGAYVRKEIYDDLMSTSMMAGDINALQSLFESGGAGTKITQYFKWAKVAANPPSHLRNITSNMILVHMSGVPLHMIPDLMVRSIKELATNGKYYRIAKKHGLVTSTFASQELPDIQRDTLDYLARTGSGFGPWLHIQNIAAIASEKFGRLYQGEEMFGKLIKLMYEMEQGATQEEAAAEAQKWLFDYSQVPPLVRWARNAPMGVPFLTFYYKALPRIAEAMVTRPWVFLPYIALPKILAAMVADRYDVDDDDVEALMEAMPDWIREKGHPLLWPEKDKYGRWRVTDISYLFPWGMFSEMRNNVGDSEFGQLIETTGLLGGPVADIATAIRMNRDSFTDKPIIDDRDPPQAQLISALTYMYDMFAPTWLSSKGAVKRIADAHMGTVNPKTGDMPLDPEDAWWRMFGINTYAFDAKESRDRNIRYMNFDTKDTARRMKEQLRMAITSGATKEQLDEITDAYMERINRMLDETKAYKERSRIHPNLR